MEFEDDLTKTTTLARCSIFFPDNFQKKNKKKNEENSIIHRAGFLRFVDEQWGRKGKPYVAKISSFSILWSPFEMLGCFSCQIEGGINLIKSS